MSDLTALIVIVCILVNVVIFSYKLGDIHQLNQKIRRLERIRRELDTPPNGVTHE